MKQGCQQREKSTEFLKINSSLIIKKFYIIYQIKLEVLF